MYYVVTVPVTSKQSSSVQAQVIAQDEQLAVCAGIRQASGYGWIYDHTRTCTVHPL